MAIKHWEPLLSEWSDFFTNFKQLPFTTGDIATDLYEENGNIVVKMDIPGFNPDNLEVTLEDKSLRISGSWQEKGEQPEEGERNYYLKEIKRGSFERVIRLPSPVAQDQVQAQFKDGVLTITLPKQEATTQKQKIQVARQAKPEKPTAEKAARGQGQATQEGKSNEPATKRTPSKRKQTQTT
jgi:HSP20 family molecular chaperone IbpA